MITLDGFAALSRAVHKPAILGYMMTGRAA